jgi:hypothetical protein
VIELLERAIDAHGGTDRWSALRTIAIEAVVGGALWDVKGQTGLFASQMYDADLHAQRAVISHFGSPNRRVRWSPEQVVLETEFGEVIDTRNRPRAAFDGHGADTPWDQLHAAYFDAYALWTYLTLPFLYAYPGFEVMEIEPWKEDNETWRRLKVIFPKNIASHTREQISYFGPDSLLRRHDYAVDVLGGGVAAHYIDDYRNNGGIQVPHRRRVYPRGEDNRKINEPLLVAIDIGRVVFSVP